jgi:non-haem Fe2+, alpha-ketoglutarate-dependent halogenase
VGDPRKEQFVRNGFFFPVTVYDPPAAERLYSRFVIEAPALIGPGNENPHLRKDWILEIARHERLLEFVAEILGPDIYCLSSRFFAKDPGGAAFVSWHQDGTYCGLSDPRDMMTAWVAFTDVTVQSGAVKMIPGTHDQQRPHVDTYAQANMLTRGQRVAIESEESRAVDVLLKPGQASFHHPYVVHGSPPNVSSGPRIGFGIQYVAPRAKPLATFESSPFLVRGQDSYGHFKNHVVRHTAS